jgi:predicted phosphoribosyltransferase
MLLLLNRITAGIALGEEVQRRVQHHDTVVLGLARGGVPVAYQVAKATGAPMDVLVVRKLGVPGHEELAFGAIAPDGIRVVTDEVVSECGVSDRSIAEVERRERTELKRRELLYRSGAAPVRVSNREVVLVDDGIATGASMMAAVRWAKAQKASRIIVAAPVGAKESCRLLLGEGCDECICSHTPQPFGAVGLWYQDFAAVEDLEVQGFLQERQEQVVCSPN